MGELRIGVDLGGTKIEAAVVRVDGTEPEVFVRERVATERDKGYEHIVERVAELVRRVADEARAPSDTPVGVGMPGSVTLRRADGTRSDVPLVKNSNTTCMNGRPFRDDLSRRLGAPVAFSNDANCFALAEARFGAARGARVAFGVIMGTGVGGGIVLSDAGVPRAWDGLQGIGGEWGHVTLDPDGGPLCYCGRRGCIEQYLSGPALERAYETASGARLPLTEISAGRQTDPHAAAVLGDALRTFGRAIATVINILDPDVIVLGGGVSNVELFHRDGPAAVREWVFNDSLETPIVKNTLGDSAGVFGAALLHP